MKLKIFYLILIGLIMGCDKICDDPDLKTTRQEYNGNAIKMNGLYYSKVSTQLGLEIPWFFSKNGIVRKGCSASGSSVPATFSCSANASEMEKIASSKPSWGVFIIENDKIRIEKRSFNGEDQCGYVLSNFDGKILNDTTLLFPNKANGEHTRLDTFYFLPFSPKPDSVTSFIK